MKILSCITLILVLSGCGAHSANNLLAMTGNPTRNFEADKSYCIRFATQYSYNYDLGVEMFLQCMESKGHARGNAKNKYNPNLSNSKNKIGDPVLSHEYCTRVYVESEKKLDKLLTLADFCVNGRGFASADACDEAADLHLEWSTYAQESEMCLRAGNTLPTDSMIEYKLGRYGAIIDSLKSNQKYKTN